MTKFKFLTLLVLFQLVFSVQVQARDFDWLNQLSIEAKADPSGFVARLSTRFHVGDAEVRAVIDNVGGQADAYMVMRLAEMSHRPIAYVTERYRESRHQGWGVLAKRLGIKPGSRQFHALKAGHDLGGMGKGNGKGRDRGPGHGHGKSKHKNKGRGHDD
jgi:hypothetical protein